MEDVHLSACEHCGHDVTHLGLTALPVEPLYDLRIAAYLIPMRYEAIRKWLYRNRERFPARYRLHGRSHRRIRLLSASEIRLIRAMCLRTGWRNSEAVGTRLLRAMDDVPSWAEPSCVMDAPPKPLLTPHEAIELQYELVCDEERGGQEISKQQETSVK
jgi:hypothetical protein